MSEEARLRVVANKMLDLANKKAPDAWAIAFLVEGGGLVKIVAGQRIKVDSVEELTRIELVLRDMVDAVLGKVAEDSGLPYTPTARQ